MGWLWATPSPPKPASPVQEQSRTPPASENKPINQSAPEEPIDPEIQKFFDLFKSDTASEDEKARSSAPSSSPQSISKTSSSSSSSSSSWFSLHAPSSSSSTTSRSRGDAAADAPPHDALSEALLPTEMSCRQAFDLAWSCNSLGGQWNAVYRYGQMRSCSEHWDDFWFCMRTKSYTGEVKDNLIRAHYRNKEHAKYRTPGRVSSEDIWESRTEKVVPGTAFTEVVEAPSVSDDEWRSLESARRQEIRDGLGFDKQVAS